MSSCDLFVPSGSAQAHSHLYHFHLIIDCCCAHPISWLGGSNNTQLMLSSSGLMVTWWPIVKMFSFHWGEITGQELCLKGRRVVCRDGRALLLNPRGLSCYSPVRACQMLQTASQYTTNSSCSFRFARSYAPSARAVWTCWRAFCSRLHTIIAALQVTWYMGQSNKHPSEECAFSRIQIGPVNVVLLSWWWKGPSFSP